MGVKYLWEMLASAKTVKPLSNLQGKTLAIDLSIWICEFAAVSTEKDNKGIIFR